MYKNLFQILNTPTFLGVKKLLFYQNRNNTPVLQYKAIFHYIYITSHFRITFFSIIFLHQLTKI